MQTYRPFCGLAKQSFCPVPLQVTVRQLDMKLASGLTTAAIEGLAATAHMADDPVRVTMCSTNEVYSD